MKRKIIMLLATACISLQAAGMDWRGLTDSLTYFARLGYNVGGTAPVGLPASIRKLNSYKIPANISLALDVYKPLDGRWGIMAGLHFGNKGMETDARVKSYYMEITQGGESLEGYFTGNVLTKVEEWLVTIPIEAVYDVSHSVRLRVGPYVSYVLSHHFHGDAYDGYLRRGTPVGVRGDLGNEPETRGSYDFSEHMRKFQFGLQAGMDYQFSRRWGAYAALSWGLTGVFKSDFHTIEQTLYPLYGTIGLSYKFR